MEMLASSPRIRCQPPPSFQLEQMYGHNGVVCVQPTLNELGVHRVSRCEQGFQAYQSAGILRLLKVSLPQTTGSHTSRSSHSCANSTRTGCVPCCFGKLVDFHLKGRANIMPRHQVWLLWLPSPLSATPRMPRWCVHVTRLLLVRVQLGLERMRSLLLLQERYGEHLQ